MRTEHFSNGRIFAELSERTFHHINSYEKQGKSYNAGADLFNALVFRNDANCSAQQRAEIRYVENIKRDKLGSNRTTTTTQQRTSVQRQNTTTTQRTTTTQTRPTTTPSRTTTPSMNSGASRGGGGFTGGGMSRGGGGSTGGGMSRGGGRR